MANQEINQLAIERMAEIERLVKKVVAKAEKSKKAVCKDGSRNWGHVGDMAYVIENLKDMVGENG